MKQIYANKYIRQYFIFFKLSLRLKAIFILLFIMLSLTGKTQQQKACEHAAMIVKSVEKFHIQARTVDNEYAELVFENFIELLDPGANYFNKVEMEKLKALKDSLDEYILNEDCRFLELAFSIYNRKIEFADSILLAYQNQPLDFSKADTILVREKSIFRSKEKQLERWEKLIKYHTLDLYYGDSDSVSQAAPTEQELEKYKQKAIDRLSCRLQTRKNHQGGLSAYVESCYLKSVAAGFDPHTNYFSRAEEENFTHSLSRTNRSFGFELSTNDFGELEIVQIIPGGPAWNSNELNEGDILLNAAAPGKFKDFDCVSRKEAISFLDNEELETAVFLIRKKNGEEISVSLRKKELDVQDNIIKSFILKGKKNVGYIYLPSFYSEMQDNYSTANGCANDVARELIKLKREGISGLILDLRNNGGGSMMEAVLMAGIFIDYGAVGIAQQSGEEPATLKDRSRGTIYTDPLIILVNNFSASASEFFAAAMQDQNRAVIVGSPTLGKSTMQQIVPIDAYRYSSTSSGSDNAEAYVKLTIGAFNRVTGETHQKTGVIPDVKLPTLYDSLLIGEASYPSALEPMTVEKKTYYYPKEKQDTESLQKRCSERLKQDTAFNTLIELSGRLAEIRSQRAIPLSIDGFRNYLNENESFEIPEANGDYKVENPAYLKGISSTLDSDKEINEDIMKNIEHSLYVNEAYQIMLDLLRM